ncbi:MAG: hypothetical protein KatS3mg126_2529 [Lysobacteraceae bacterium]|nr:MAG: hypothetical protein KatS3mg126_2529 [Xanthomonadaceae bacterium]
MFLPLHKQFAADGVERAVADRPTAERLLRDCRPDFLELLGERRRIFLSGFAEAEQDLLERTETALMISLARMGMRHGSWGDDFHHYHNENHALEILDGRLGRMMERCGLESLPLFDWLALSLFATCHDLRQREAVDFSHPIGNNEAASICETRRILALSGFDRHRDRRLFTVLDLMIAGSTFDPRPAPPPSEYNTAELAATAGALAPHLPQVLDREVPGWREDADAVHGVALAQLASDLDTANVGEAFFWLAESASRLCQEREMRSGRSLDAAQSAQPCLEFLTHGQEFYFFELHRFCSEPGRTTFAASKAENAERLRQVTRGLRERFREQGPASGQTVVEAFSALSLAH